MRASENEETKKMMLLYDEALEGGELPCDPDEGVPCDLQIGNDIGFGRVTCFYFAEYLPITFKLKDYSRAFGGPDDYIFDKKRFSFMANRFHSCQLTYYKVPMGVQYMVYGLRKNVPYMKAVNLAIIR